MMGNEPSKVTPPRQPGTASKCEQGFECTACLSICSFCSRSENLTHSLLRLLFPEAGATGKSGTKHVQIKEEPTTTNTTTTTTTNSTTRVKNGKTKKENSKQLRMDESAHTFAHNNASVTSRFKRGGSPVMITDALSDVRATYHIESKELGHGHYGVVRKCMHRESGEWYAIKSIRKSKVSKIEVLKREIEILKEVKHPHIIELIEVYEDERYLHLITELCTGGELFDRIIAKTQSSEGHFSEHDAATLVRDILDAIRYCHDEKG